MASAKLAQQTTKISQDYDTMCQVDIEIKVFYQLKNKYRKFSISL